MKKRIAILGSTGSIGENALRVIRHLGPEFELVGIAAGHNARRLGEQAAEFNCAWAAVADASRGDELARAVPQTCRALSGMEPVIDLVAADNIDMVLCAVVGTAGLQPVLAAIRAGKDIALASKEILVMAGEQVMCEVRRHNVRILPVDSEHSAIFQCLDGRQTDQIQRLMLTASGGPFVTKPASELAAVTRAQALAHPTWSMGDKITIDSATLMNKGLEVIEAHWLFDVAPSKIEVLIHPQSIVHSMVEWVDGSILAQIGNPDMCLPIQYALTYPERRQSLLTPLSLAEATTLEFSPPDHHKFPALKLAKHALTMGGTAPAVFNAANETAVERFLRDEIKFPRIWHIVEQVLALHKPQPATLDIIIEADKWARQIAARA